MNFKIMLSTMWTTRPITLTPLMPTDDYLNLGRVLLNSEKLVNLPALEFSVDTPKKHLPDFMSLGPVWLLSVRFIELLRDYGVLFESFSIRLNTRLETCDDYHLFNLLQICPIVDIGKSNIHGLTDYDNLILLELNNTSEFSMVRDNFLRKIFVRDDLIQEILQKNISGCEWEDPADYSFHLRRKKW